MKTTTLQNRILTLRIAPIAGLLLAAAQVASAADIYWDGPAGNWDVAANWSTAAGATAPEPGAAPGAADIARFSISTVTGGQIVALNGDQSALGLVYNNTLTSAMGIRSGTSPANTNTPTQTLNLGVSGLTWGTGQVDLGAGSQINTFTTNTINPTNTYTINLAGTQSWTNTSGVAAGALLQSFATITTNTNSLVTLTLGGANAANKNFFGPIKDNIADPLGVVALVINNPGATFGNTALWGNNTYSGGTTLTAGFLAINNNSAIGSGPLTIGGGQIICQALAGVALTTTNVMNWNGNFNLAGNNSLDFGTGDVFMNGNRTITFGSSGNSPTFTVGGAISGAGFSLTTASNASGPVNSMLNLLGGAGGNTYDGGTNINGNLVRFANLNAIPATGSVTLGGGGALAVSGAYSTIADWLADPRLVAPTGALALASDSSETFTPGATRGGLALGAQLGTVVKYTGTYNPTGSFYQVGGGGGTIIFRNDNAFTGARNVQTANGGGGTVTITGQNSFTGQTMLNNGTIEAYTLNSISGGTPTSNLGAPTTVANGRILMGQTSGGATLRYLGPGETTDRGITFNSNFGGGASLDSSGTGPLGFTGDFNVPNISANGVTRTFTLRGINKGGNFFVGSIINGLSSATTQPITALTKNHRGSWLLNGASTLTGAVSLNGGTLNLDYITSQVLPITATNAVNFGGGRLAIIGSGGGLTSQGLGNLTLTANTGQSQISVTGNSGPNSAILTLGNTWTRNANAYLDINLSNGRVTSSPALSNGVVVGSGTVAAFTVTDTAGTDFATVTGGNIARLGAATALPSTGGVNTANYVLAGSLTLTGAVAANTVRIDTSASGGTLDVTTTNTNNLTVARTTLLKDGVNPYTITGARLAPNNGTIGIATFGAGALTVSAAITAGTGSVLKTGPGLLDVTAPQAYTGATSIYGGIWRTTAVAGTGTGNIALSTGGILELASGDFLRSIGTAANQIQWQNGDGGFSAFGGNRIVNLGGAAATMAWGSFSNNFVTAPSLSPNFIKDGFALLLSSTTSDSTIEFANGLDLVNAPRVVEVANGSAAVDARLTGPITASGNGSLVKAGAGTLVISGTQNYPRLTATEGTTALATALGTGTSTIDALAKVDIYASQTLEALIIADGAVVTVSNPPPPAANFAADTPDLGALGVSAQAVPEPGIAASLSAGLGLLLGRRRRRA